MRWSSRFRHALEELRSSFQSGAGSSRGELRIETDGVRNGGELREFWNSRVTEVESDGGVVRFGDGGSE